MDNPDDLRKAIADFTSVFERYVTEYIRNNQEHVKQYALYQEQFERSLQASEEYNRLKQRDTEINEENARRYRKSLADYGHVPKRLGILLGIGVLVIIVLVVIGIITNNPK